MSYDITLYDRDFLISALERRLGDWTTAPAIPADVRAAIAAETVLSGFKATQQDPRFVAFAAAQGHTVADEYTLDSVDCLATLMVFPGSVAFAIPSSPRATSSIKHCTHMARSFASKFHLGCYDPQSGEVTA